MTSNYKKADVSANATFRTIISEQGLGAEDAVHILTGMLCEWQREAMFQALVNEQQQTAAEKPADAEI